MTTAEVEARFQALSLGIELLNLLFVVDEIERKTTIDLERKQILQMFLLRSPAYSKNKVANDAYLDLMEFMDHVMPSNSEPRHVNVELKLEKPESRKMLEFLRAVSAQKSAEPGVRYNFESIEDPAAATRSMIDELLALLGQ